MSNMISFHKPFVDKEEAAAASAAVLRGSLSGNGDIGRRFESAVK